MAGAHPPSDGGPTGPNHLASHDEAVWEGAESSTGRRVLSGCTGRCVRSVGHDDTNLLRCVGPQRAVGMINRL